AFIEIFRLRRRVEILIEILRLVQDGHPLRLIHPVFDKRIYLSRECPQHLVILCKVAQHDRRNRKDDIWRRVSQFRQAMMNQEAMDAAIAIFEWMHKDKTESRQRS